MEAGSASSSLATVRTAERRSCFRFSGNSAFEINSMTSASVAREGAIVDISGLVRTQVDNSIES